MPVKRTIHKPYGTYFITFTCYKWLHLTSKTNTYNSVYNWFDYLKQNGHYINAFVIMPNHVHAIISFKETGASINTIIGNGKRFMAYEIINNLKEQKDTDTLNYLGEEVEEARRKKNKQHQVWELSFDWKECTGKEFTMQKINYIHNNPCSKKWNLCESPEDYKHSSARQYICEEIGFYAVTHISWMEDIKLSNGQYE